MDRFLSFSPSRTSTSTFFLEKSYANNRLLSFLDLYTQQCFSCFYLDSVDTKQRMSEAEGWKRDEEKKYRILNTICVNNAIHNIYDNATLTSTLWNQQFNSTSHTNTLLDKVSQLEIYIEIIFFHPFSLYRNGIQIGA